MLTSEQRGSGIGTPVLCLVTVNWAVIPWASSCSSGRLGWDVG